MKGLGIIRGVGVGFRHFIDTYLVDLKWKGQRYKKGSGGLEDRIGKDARGIFTIQFPEEEYPVPEEFRYIPFLVYELGEGGEKKYRCTGCGICAKACPPQCISITRASDPVTGKPVAASAEFHIDIDICMNCGMCAEYCPFDAIKMDHDFKIASYNRMTEHLLNKEMLGKPVSHYAAIRPTNYAREEAEKQAKAAKKAGGEATSA